MNPTQLIHDLTEQLTCYQTLAKLSDQQREHIQHSRTEQLLEVLGQRQTVLEQIARLERSISPARKQWSTLGPTLTVQHREAAESLFLQTRDLLEQITRADQNDVLVLQQRKINVGRQLAGTTTGQTVNRAYAAAAYGQRGSSMNVQK